ncbi:MAG: potassium channel protein [Bacteroidia bacterium]|nr:potassium channel protein [Bacteroidia bacterium]NNF32260.1 potassium channel protein [Flavobacteriaceae bacterium]MBT8276902.1 potassium channel protein [Bacteroidia bacterium]NNJ82906.1 potassium channel protein [Flavobacteriaceae bacterium]NNK53781.1 potassium channel protein [Flavobacteriaceae bacterium]
MKRLFKSEIFGALFLVLGAFVTGVLGFKFFSDYSWIDAIYMTVITITTVGYGEVHPLSPNEKIFASLLIISSIFVVGYAIKVISEYFLSQNNIGNFKLKRVKRSIEYMEGHVIVCGYGRNGRQATEKLMDYNQKFVVIEMDDDIINQHSKDDTLFVQGNAVEDETLIEARINQASSLICALPSDADNLFIVLSARQINPNLKIISRATEETSFKKLKLAGADNVILPDKIGGDHMANLVVTPDLVEFLDNLSVSGEKDSINVEQIGFENVCPDGAEKSIRELDIRKKTGCSIIGYKGPDGEYVVNPEPSLKIEKESKLILIGRPDQIRNLMELYNV